MMGIAQLPPGDGIYVVEETRDRPARLSVSKLEDNPGLGSSRNISQTVTGRH